MVISLIGLSSSGKSAVGEELVQRFKAQYPNTVLLDGDALRATIAPDLGHTYEDRRESEARRSKLCKLLADQGIHVVLAGLSNYPEWRQWCRDHIFEYFEVYLQVPMDVLIQRDRKGIYKQAQQGNLTNVVGIDIPFETPDNPDLTVDNTGEISINQVVRRILNSISRRFNMRFNM